MDEVWRVEPVNRILSGASTECLNLYYGDDFVCVRGGLQELCNILSDLEEGQSQDLTSDPIFNPGILTPTVIGNSNTSHTIRFYKGTPNNLQNHWILIKMDSSWTTQDGPGWTISGNSWSTNVFDGDHQIEDAYFTLEKPDGQYYIFLPYYDAYSSGTYGNWMWGKPFATLEEASDFVSTAPQTNAAGTAEWIWKIARIPFNTTINIIDYIVE